MSLDYDHIISHDTRCWCGPQVFIQEETISQELFPDVWAIMPVKRVHVMHFESSLAPRKHGHPRKPRRVHTGLL